MSDDVLVKVDGVSKKFCRSLKRSMWYGICDVASEVTGKVRQSAELRRNEFWAVSDVSFRLKRGECLGLIGPNGAGKSTLLKMLNGLIKPDQGSITLRGRVGALIELGAGFNPILTARENIFVNGAVLGFTTNQIAKKFDEIVDFAEIEEFVDSPVQNFSSGMKVRLGFAVAAQMEPDVLLIDEVLAVGDVGFRAKCFNRIQEMQENCALVFVSHVMPQVSRICDSTLLLHHGEAIHLGDIGVGIQKYESLYGSQSASIKSEGAKILATRLLDIEGNECAAFYHGSRLFLEIEVLFEKNFDEVTFNLHFVDQSQQYVYQANSRNDDLRFKDIDEGCYKVRIETPPLKLNSGQYACSFVIRDKSERRFIAWAHSVLPFAVHGNKVGVSPYQDRVTWIFNSIKPSGRG